LHAYRDYKEYSGVYDPSRYRIQNVTPRQYRRIRPCFGAYAVTAYAEPRATGDIDLWVEPTEENAARVLQALITFGAPISEISKEELAQPGLIFQLGVPPVRIDLLTAIDGVNFDDAWRERAELKVGQETFPLISRAHRVPLRPTLDTKLYNELFSSKSAFTTREVECRSQGLQYAGSLLNVPHSRTPVGEPYPAPSQPCEGAVLFSAGPGSPLIGLELSKGSL
jgi:hypothetical protein